MFTKEEKKDIQIALVFKKLKSPYHTICIFKKHHKK